VNPTCCDRGPVAVRTPRTARRPGAQRVQEQATCSEPLELLRESNVLRPEDRSRSAHPGPRDVPARSICRETTSLRPLTSETSDLRYCRWARLRRLLDHL